MYKRISLLISAILLPVLLALILFESVPKPSRANILLTNSGSQQGIKRIDPEVYEEFSAIGIEVPAVGISLPVEEGVYNPINESWTLDDNKAYWANLSSPLSNASGNSLIYAHNKWGAFYQLKNIEVGDQVIVHTEEGEKLIYEYEYDKVVQPRDNELFEYDDDTYLTMLTCSGFFSEVRRIMVSRLVEIR